MLYPEIVIAGCGNPLFADDGFGPAVAEKLKKIPLPENVKAVDAGIGGTYHIFTLLDPETTKKLIIVETTDFGAEPGSITQLRASDLPSGCYCDAFAWDIAEPLQQIKERIDILIVGCQPKRISYPEVEIGLSDEVLEAVPRAVRILLDTLGTARDAPL